MIRVYRVRYAGETRVDHLLELDDARARARAERRAQGRRLVHLSEMIMVHDALHYRQILDYPDATGPRDESLDCFMYPNRRAGTNPWCHCQTCKHVKRQRA